jgi:hypothetical protein
VVDVVKETFDIKEQRPAAHALRQRQLGVMEKDEPCIQSRAGVSSAELISWD